MDNSNMVFWCSVSASLLLFIVWTIVVYACGFMVGYTRDKLKEQKDYSSELKKELSELESHVKEGMEL